MKLSFVYFPPCSISPPSKTCSCPPQFLDHSRPCVPAEFNTRDKYLCQVKNRHRHGTTAERKRTPSSSNCARCKSSTPTRPLGEGGEANACSEVEGPRSPGSLYYIGLVLVVRHGAELHGMPPTRPPSSARTIASTTDWDGGDDEGLSSWNWSVRVRTQRGTTRGDTF